MENGLDEMTQIDCKFEYRNPKFESINPFRTSDFVRWRPREPGKNCDRTKSVSRGSDCATVIIIAQGSYYSGNGSKSIETDSNVGLDNRSRLE